MIVKSNHDLHLNRYLEEGRYINDYQNHYLSLLLARWMFENKDPIKEFITPKLKHPNKFIWLQEDEEKYIENIKISDHGHNSFNGAKGSTLAIEKTCYKAVVGHSHSPQILREIYRVGTCTYLRLDYTKGATSWFNTSCLIYPGGARTLINVINGKWTLMGGAATGMI
jgi:hypothetical protein